MNKYILELKNISKKYGSKSNEITVLDNISFSIKEGEIVGLIGQSGCGKTTLLNICGLLDNVDGGELYLNTKLVNHLNESERNKIRGNNIGFIYQFHHLLPDFTALENVMMPALINSNYKVKDKNAVWLLEQFGLSDRINYYPNQLSGGEQQRVAIARSLINNPNLILADEPTGNLDPSTAEMVMNHMLEFLKKCNRSALIVTHNHQLISKFDRTLTFDNGLIKEL